MKINPKEISAYLKNPSNLDSIFLIYGSNDGLINKTYNSILQELDIDKNDPFSTIKININQILNDKSLLFDEIQTYSVFDTNKNILIDIRNAPELKNIKNIFDELITYNLSNIRIIIIASYIKANDKIIDLINKYEKGICIACYEPEEYLLNQQLKNYINQNKIKVSEKDISNLVSEFSKNTEINENIFEKLDLLSLSEKVTLQNLTDTLNDASDIEINELINNSLNGNYMQAIKVLNKCKKSKIPCVSICKKFIYKFKLLEKIILMNDEGLPLEKIILQPSLKIFYKEREILIKQLKKWDFQKIQNSIYKFIDTEIKCKKMSEIDYFFLENALLFLKVQSQKI